MKCYYYYPHGYIYGHEGYLFHEAVGRCNHKSRCGYHYTPKQFFSDHPEALPEWKDKLSPVRGLDITTPDVLEKETSFEDRAHHVDIADLLIRQYRKEHIEITPVEQYEDPRMHPTFLKLKRMVGGCDMGELALLVNELDLEVEGWQSG
ncbi:MAG: hypothetical protein PHS38_14980 [Bacteroidales bacterium]|nr:hypothetical protein [Bacteroidales bacterium]